MELIDRYVHAVTRHLPQTQRNEVSQELRSTIQDMVADRAEGKKPTSKIVESVLKELGNPEALAFQYRQGPRYLIGPKWYALYWRLLTRMLIVVPVAVAVLALPASVMVPNVIPIQVLLTTIGAGLGAAIQVCFWVTLIFAILEWTETNPSKTALTRDWNPSDLPERPAKRQISKVDAIAGMVFITIVTLLALAAPIVPAGWLEASVPVLNHALLQMWIPLFVALGVLDLILEIYKYRIGNWTPTLVVANVLLNLASIAYVVIIATTQQILNPEFVQQLQSHIGADLSQAGHWPTVITVAIIIASCALSAGGSVRQAMQNNHR